MSDISDILSRLILAAAGVDVRALISGVANVCGISTFLERSACMAS